MRQHLKNLIEKLLTLPDKAEAIEQAINEAIAEEQQRQRNSTLSI